MGEAQNENGCVRVHREGGGQAHKVLNNERDLAGVKNVFSSMGRGGMGRKISNETTFIGSEGNKHGLAWR